MSKYGYSPNGTPLRENGTPENSAFGSKAEYDEYLKTEDARKQYNKDTYEERTNAKLNGSYYPSYDDYMGGSYGGSYGGGSYGGGMSAAQRALQKAIEDNVRAMELSKKGVGQQYDDIAAQQYVAYKQNQSNLPGQLAGRSDGDIESLKLQATANYQNALSGTLQEKQNAFNSIDQDIASTKATGNLQLAEAAERYAQEAMRREQELADREAQQKWEMEKMAYQNQLSSQAYKDKLAMQQYYDNLQYGDSENSSKTGNGNPNTGGGTSLTSEQLKVKTLLERMGINSVEAEKRALSGNYGSILNNML